jgi:hypothetical protein
MNTPAKTPVTGSRTTESIAEDHERLKTPTRRSAKTGSTASITPAPILSRCLGGVAMPSICGITVLIDEVNK